jgi:protein-S-isoprenylcysteine O-methyltransferase Ste14
MNALDAPYGVLWLVFWLYWLLAAIGSGAHRSERGRFVLVRLGVLALVVALFALHPRVARATHALGFEVAGLVLLVAGLGLAVWARRSLGRNWGMPMSRRDDAELVTTGPYRRVRHPIYSGILLGALGTAIGMSLSWLVPAALLGAYFVFSAKREEAFLLERFPDTYPAYRRSTKMLIPFVF